jgi:hypothetical protein
MIIAKASYHPSLTTLAEFLLEAVCFRYLQADGGSEILASIDSLVSQLLFDSQDLHCISIGQ